MRIIPTIEIVEGKCLGLTNNSSFNSEKIYNENPIEVAKEFEAIGMQYLHLVDLDGIKSKRVVNFKILEQITSKTNLKIDFKSGLHTDEDVHIAFNSGAKQIIGDQIVVKNPKIFESWLSKYGGIKIILAANCNNGKMNINSSQEYKDVISFIKSYESKGIKYVICKNIGGIEEPSLQLYNHILDESKDLKLIASGGINTLEDINSLEDLGCEAAIIGSAIYDGQMRLRDLETYS